MFISVLYLRTELKNTNDTSFYDVCNFGQPIVTIVTIVTIIQAESVIIMGKPS